MKNNQKWELIQISEVKRIGELRLYISAIYSYLERIGELKFIIFGV